MKCKECGHELGKESKFCPDCGRAVLHSDNKISCANCCEEIDKDSKFCIKCGEPIVEKNIRRNGGYKENKDFSKNRKKDRKRREGDDDDDEEGGILGGIGDFVGKLFG